ncbi:retrovirus-related pol polyprotein from transposon TNT 1-94 [Tanacetum coccineum]
MNERCSKADHILDFKALDSQNIELTEHVIALQEQNEHFRAENEKLDTRYSIEVDTSYHVALGMHAIDVELIPPQNRNNREAHLDYLKHLNGKWYETSELIEYVIGTCSKEFSKRDKKVATTPLNRKKQVTFRETCGTSNNNTQTHVEQQKVQKTNVGVNSSTVASGSKPRSNKKKNRILPAKSDNKKKVEDHPRNNKSNLKQENRVDSSISSKRTVWKATGKLFANVGYQWKPTGKKFTLGEQCPLTRITNSKVVPLQQPEHISTSEIVITERFSNTTQKPLTRIPTKIRDPTYQTLHLCLFSNACRTDRLVSRFRLTFRGAIIGYRDYVIGNSVISMNGIVKRWNHTLVEAAWTMLIFSKASMFLWAEAVTTVCYTQNRSLIHTRHNKTPYELMHGKKPDLTFLRIFGALCYFTNDNEDLGKLKAKVDIRIFFGYAPNRKGPEPILMMPGQICSRLVPNPVPVAPYIPPTNKNLEILLQPMFDEYFEPPSVERPIPHAPTVQVLVVSTGTPSSTIIDQDAPSTSHSPSYSKVQPPILHQGVVARPSFKDNPFARANNDPFVSVFAPKPSFDESSSGDVCIAEPNQVIQPHDHLGKWTKDHLIDNLIVKPKNFKTAVTEPCWFDAMQEEIHEFD